MKQAADFLAEANALAALLAPLDDATFNTPTLFKGWTINDVLGHLHLFDTAALISLQGPDKIDVFLAPIITALNGGQTFIEAQTPWLDGLSGRALFDAWHAGTATLAAAYAEADPKQRLKWVGPDMSARSSITARQMETWAHGQEVFDALGQTRAEADRITNICHMGAATFGWAYQNRGLPVPPLAPALHLTTPSGAAWDWTPEGATDSITGDAVDFARVVTQVRHIEDTALVLNGDTAKEWMQIAQCYAGDPTDPPKPGSRRKSNAHPSGNLPAG